MSISGLSGSSGFTFTRRARDSSSRTKGSFDLSWRSRSRTRSRLLPLSTASASKQFASFRGTLRSTGGRSRAILALGRVRNLIEIGSEVDEILNDRLAGQAGTLGCGGKADYWESGTGTKKESGIERSLRDIFDSGIGSGGIDSEGDWV